MPPSRRSGSSSNTKSNDITLPEGITPAELQMLENNSTNFQNWVESNKIQLNYDELVAYAHNYGLEQTFQEPTKLLYNKVHNNAALAPIDENSYEVWRNNYLTTQQRILFNNTPPKTNPDSKFINSLINGNQDVPAGITAVIEEPVVNQTAIEYNNYTINEDHSGDYNYLVTDSNGIPHRFVDLEKAQNWIDKNPQPVEQTLEETKYHAIGDYYYSPKKGSYYDTELKLSDGTTVYVHKSQKEAIMALLEQPSSSAAEAVTPSAGPAVNGPLSPEYFATLSQEEQQKILATIPLDKRKDFIDAAFTASIKKQPGYKSSIPFLTAPETETSSSSEQIEMIEEVQEVEKPIVYKITESGRDNSYLISANGTASVPAFTRAELGFDVPIEIDGTTYYTNQSGAERLKSPPKLPYNSGEDRSFSLSMDGYDETVESGDLEVGNKTVPYSSKKGSYFNTEVIKEDGTKIYVPKKYYEEHQDFFNEKGSLRSRGFSSSMDGYDETVKSGDLEVGNKTVPYSSKKGSYFNTEVIKEDGTKIYVAGEEYEAAKHGKIGKSEVEYRIEPDATFTKKITLKDGEEVYVRENQFGEAQAVNLDISYKFKNGNEVYVENPDSPKGYKPDYVYIITGSDGQPLRDDVGNYIYTDYNGYKESKEAYEQAQLAARQKQINDQLGNIIVKGDFFGKSGFNTFDLSSIEGLTLTGEIIVAQYYDLKNNIFIYQIPGVGWTDIYGYNAYKGEKNSKILAAESSLANVNIDIGMLRSSYNQWISYLKNGDLAGFLNILIGMGYKIPWEEVSPEDAADAEVSIIKPETLEAQLALMGSSTESLLKKADTIQGYYENDIQVISNLLQELENLNESIGDGNK